MPERNIVHAQRRESSFATCRPTVTRTGQDSCLLRISAQMHTAAPVLALIMLAGCGTATTLNRSVLNQGSALIVAQQEMILTNLEMFRQRPYAVPWYLKVTGGSVSVDDSISPTFSFVWPPTSRTLGITPSRSITLQWNVVPTTRSSEIEALRGLFKANTQSHKPDPADPDIGDPTCQADDHFLYFDATFDEGPVYLPGEPHGSFNNVYIWVKETKQAKDCFDQIIRETWGKAPVTPQDLGLMVPVSR